MNAVGLIPTSRARSRTAWTFVCLALSLVLFVVFAKFESRTSARGREPLIVPSLFRKRAFSGGLVTGLAIFSALVGFSLVLTLYLQIGLGFSPLKGGRTVLPQALGSVIGFVASGAGLANKLGRTALHLGTVLMMLGAIGVLFITLGVDISPWQLAPALAVYGIGLGLSLAPFFDIVLAGVESHEYGSASGTLTATQQLGSALGIAILGTVFFAALGGPVSGYLAAEERFGGALRHTIWTVLGLRSLAFVLAFLLPAHARPNPNRPRQPRSRTPREISDAA